MEAFMKDLYTAIETRRSVYALGNEKVVSDDRIHDLVSFSLKNVPSAFNSQTARIVTLLGKESSKFWMITRDTLRKIVPPAAFDSTNEKINAFDRGYGTILFFEEQSIIDDLMIRYPLYKESFPVWSLQSNGMLEFAVWTTLEAEGLGASLQHYNPLIDDEVKKTWNLPESWKLLAEMPFGSITVPAGTKEFLPIEDRVRSFG
jgi:uncharacterized protein